MSNNTTTIQIDKEVADMLHNLKSRGESYSDVIRRLIDNKKKRHV